MNLYNLILAAVVIYLPYEEHYPIVLPVPGLNMVNLIFLVVLAMVMANRKGSRPPAPLGRRFFAFMAALTLSCLIGLFYDNSNLMEDVVALKTDLFYMLFYFLYYYAARDVKDIRLLFGAMLFVTFLVSLQGARQALDYGIANFKPNNRVSGPFGGGDVTGANLAAAFYVMFVPLLITVALFASSRPFVRVFALACGFLGVFAAFFTYSRQSYFILAAQFTLLFLRRNLAFGLAIIALVASYQLWAPATVIERIQSTEQADPTGEEKLDESTESRFLLWEAAGEMIASRPWGVGLFHFHKEVGRYLPAYAGYDAHNGYVLVTAETGFLGIATMVFLFLGLLGLARKVTRLDASEDTRVLGEAYTTAVIGLICANLFGSRIFNGEVMGDFWILSGLVARYYTLRLQAQETGGATRPPRAGSPGPLSPPHP